MGGTHVGMNDNPNIVIHKYFVVCDDGIIPTCESDVLHVVDGFVNLLATMKRGLVPSFTLCESYLAMTYTDERMQWVDTFLQRVYVKALEEELRRKKT
jgi:hypothetical protein